MIQRDDKIYIDYKILQNWMEWPAGNQQSSLFLLQFVYYFYVLFFLNCYYHR